MYVVTATSQGAITFEGERFVGHTGSHRGTADANTVAKLRGAIAASDFFALADCYCERKVTDMPSVIVTVEMGGQKKTVKHYTGDRSAPAQLIALQEQIDLLAGSKRWIDDPTM